MVGIFKRQRPVGITPSPDDGRLKSGWANWISWRSPSPSPRSLQAEQDQVHRKQQVLDKLPNESSTLPICGGDSGTMFQTPSKDCKGNVSQLTASEDLSSSTPGYEQDKIQTSPSHPDCSWDTPSSVASGCSTRTSSPVWYVSRTGSKVFTPARQRTLGEEEDREEDDFESTSRQLLQQALDGSTTLTDMEFVLDNGHRVRGHKGLVSTRSPYLRAMFGSGMIEATCGIVHVRECSVATFTAFLQYMYTGSIDESAVVQVDGRELWKLADLFGCDGLKKKIRMGICPATAAAAAHLAVKHNDAKLLKACVRHLAEMPLPTLVGMDMAVAWDLATAQQLCKLESFQFVMRWCEANRGSAEAGDVPGPPPSLSSRSSPSGEGKSSGVAPTTAARMVVAVMRGCEGSAEVVEKGCAALKGLCSSRHMTSDMASSLVADGGVTAVLRGMMAHPGSPQVQAQGCGALVALASMHSGVCFRIADEGGVAAILGAMHAHKGVGEVQEQACCALWALAAVDPGIAERVAGEGGIAAVMSAMGTHKEQEAVQGQGAAAVGRLHGQDAGGVPGEASGETVDPRIDMREQEEGADVLCGPGGEQRGPEADGGPGVLGQALAAADQQVLSLGGVIGTRHPGGLCGAECQPADSVDIQNQNQNPDAGESLAGRYQAGDEGKLVAKVLASIRDGQDDDDKAQGLGVLARLSSQRAYCKHVLEGGGIEAVVDAMERHRQVSAIQVHGCGVIAGACACRRSWTVRVAQMGAIGAAVHAMKAHPKSELVQRAGCASLLVLATESLTRSRIAKEGGIAAILAAMKVHSGDEALQRYACGALVSLAANHSPNRAAIAKQGGVALILAATSGHPGERHVQKNGCHALVNLSSNNVQNRSLIAKEGGCNAAIVAMRGHKDRGVHEVGCSLLLCLSSERENAYHLSGGRGIACVAASMALHLNDLEVQRLGCGYFINMATFSTVHDRLRIASEGGVKAVVGAMSAHSDRTVQIRGLIFIAIVAGKAARAGGVTAVGEGAKLGREIRVHKARDAVKAAVRCGAGDDSELQGRVQKALDAVRAALGYNDTVQTKDGGMNSLTVLTSLSRV